MKQLLIIHIICILYVGLLGGEVQNADQYNGALKQQVTFPGISIQIPKYLKKLCESDEDLYYIKPDEDGNFEICFSMEIEKQSNLKTRIKELRYGLKLADEQGAHIENFKQERCDVSNMSAEKMEYNQKTKQKQGKVNRLLLQKGNSIIDIMLYSHSKDTPINFDKIVESIAKKD